MDNQDFRWKYRPRFFSEVVGNQRTKQRLNNFVASRHLPKGILLYGPAGSGKTTLSHLLIKALYCKNFKGDLCGVCEECLKRMDDFSGGCTYYTHDCTKIDAQRWGNILRSLQYAPGWNSLHRNIHIFDEFHRTNEPLQEKLLETIEFTPKTLFIFCLIDFKKITEAFRQRVEVLKVSPPQIDELMPLLNRVCESERIVIKDAEALRQVALEANQLPRECLAMLQSIHNLKEPLTIELVKEISEERQVARSNEPRYKLAEK